MTSTENLFESNNLLILNELNHENNKDSSSFISELPSSHSHSFENDEEANEQHKNIFKNKKHDNEEQNLSQVQINFERENEEKNFQTIHSITKDTSLTMKSEKFEALTKDYNLKLGKGDNVIIIQNPQEDEKFKKLFESKLNLLNKLRNTRKEIGDRVKLISNINNQIAEKDQKQQVKKIFVRKVKTEKYKKMKNFKKQEKKKEKRQKQNFLKIMTFENNK